MQGAEAVAGVGEEQERYASAVQGFFPSAYERRKATGTGADVPLDVTTGSTAVGSSMVPDIPVKLLLGTPPPTTGKLLSLIPHLAHVMETKLKKAHVQIC